MKYGEITIAKPRRGTPPTRGRELKLYELGYTTATAGRPPRGGEN